MNSSEAENEQCGGELAWFRRGIQRVNDVVELNNTVSDHYVAGKDPSLAADTWVREAAPHSAMQSFERKI
jgi:hypothetical protein